MGVFLALASVIGKSQNEVVSSLTNYASSVNGGLQLQDNLDRETPNACIVQEENGHTSVLFPDDFFEWDNCAQFISQDLGAAVFSFHIHDSDFWMYILFDKGKIVDQFNPVPDYWDENLPDEDAEVLKGNAKMIAGYFSYIKPADIDKYLVRWDEDQEPSKAYPTDEFEKEDWQLTDFMKKLRLPYPVDDNGNPRGQTYKFWTEQLKLETQPTMSTSKSGKNSKPWWKFW